MKLIVSMILLASACLPVAEAASSPAVAHLSSFAARLAQPAAPAAVPAPEAVKAPVQSWAEAVKAAAEREMDMGGFVGFADIKELPPGARRCLEREWQILPEGPGNSSEAFKLNVNGRTAFIVQSYIYSDSMRLYIFDAAGNRVAYGEGSIEKDFAWLPFPY